MWTSTDDPDVWNIKLWVHLILWMRQLLGVITYCLKGYLRILFRVTLHFHPLNCIHILSFRRIRVAFCSMYNLCCGWFQHSIINISVFSFLHCWYCKFNDTPCISLLFYKNISMNEHKVCVILIMLPNYDIIL